MVLKIKFLNLLVLLNCFLDKEGVESALRGALAEEEMVEIRPELVPMKVLVESVSINQIKKYFTIDAWKQVEGVADCCAKEKRRMELCHLFWGS